MLSDLNYEDVNLNIHCLNFPAGFSLSLRTPAHNSYKDHSLPAPVSFHFTSYDPSHISVDLTLKRTLRFFRAFSSVVRQMPGYNSKRRGTDRTLPLCCSMLFLCVNVYCHRVTTQLQLINIIISFIQNWCFRCNTCVPVGIRWHRDPERKDYSWGEEVDWSLQVHTLHFALEYAGKRWNSKDSCLCRMNFFWNLWHTLV